MTSETERIPEVGAARAWKRRALRMRAKGEEVGVANVIHLACLSYYAGPKLMCCCGDTITAEDVSRAHGLYELLGPSKWEDRVTRRD